MERRTDLTLVPPMLRERLRASFGDSCDARASLAEGERLLEAVLTGDARSRGTALDLLAADALVTHAFECAADDPDALPAMAEAAMRRIARLATEPG